MNWSYRFFINYPVKHKAGGSHDISQMLLHTKPPKATLFKDVQLTSQSR